MDRIKNIENVMLNIIKNADINNNWYKTSEEIAHMYGVASWCKTLALKRNLDYEICVIIGLMHDIGRTKLKENGNLHAEKSAHESKKIISDLKMFNKTEIENIYNSILTHSDKHTKGNDYQELIKDADVFEKYIRTPEKINSTQRQNRVNFVKEELGISN